MIVTYRRLYNTTPKVFLERAFQEFCVSQSTTIKTTYIIADMEKALLDIAEQLKTLDHLDDRALTKVINRHNKRILEEAKTAQSSRSSLQKADSASELNVADSTRALDPASNEAAPSITNHTPALDAVGAKINPVRPLSKRHLIAYYLDVKRNDPDHWAQWNFTEEQQRRIERTLQMKPRRTASGVATITVLTKPWKCSSNCLYCPNDLRMPKSYLSDEPACQRAERTFFDPYLQVAARLKALTEMGHVTDKVELIVLGGTWSDYSLSYQIWFVRELFRALNDGSATQKETPLRRARYEEAGLSSDPETLIQQTSTLQKRIFNQELTYNQAFDLHYGTNKAWQEVASWQSATWEELESEHLTNESAQHRVVGLVIETRPNE